MDYEKKEKIANLVKDYVCSYCGCTYEHIMKALDRINTTGAYTEFFELDAKHKDNLVINSDKLFAPTIDKSIKYLQELKNEGYTQIEEKWSGYEDNYFVASRYIMESKNDYKYRISKLIIEYVVSIQRQEEEINKKRTELEAKKKELERLEKLFNN